jgi:hypothetical protein
MTHKELDEMWQIAMLTSIEKGEMYTRYEFAKLVAAKEREEFAVHAVDIARRAIGEEREACAEICDRFQARDVGMQPAECAGAIRARGEA